MTNFISLVNEVFAGIIKCADANPGLIQGIGSIGVTAVAAGTGIGALGAALSVIASHPIIAGLSVIAAGVIHLANEFYKAHDAVTGFDEALQQLQGRRTYGDPNEVQAMITRFEQLAAKEKLTAEEQTEARKTMRALRMEFGKLAGFVDDNGRIANVEKMRAQLQAARGGRSHGVQFHEIGQAEAALGTREAEGADATELQTRREALAKMRENLARTDRIVADAEAAKGPTTPPMPSGPPTQTHLGQSLVGGISAAVKQGAEAANRAAAGAPAFGLGEMLGNLAGGFDLGGFLDAAQEKLGGFLDWFGNSNESGSGNGFGGTDVGRSEAVLDARYASQQFGRRGDEIMLLTEISRASRKTAEHITNLRSGVLFT